MNFRIDYAENILRTLTHYAKQQKNTRDFWSINLHVSKFWHFQIDIQFFARGEQITITHKRRGLTLMLEDGFMTKSDGIRRFDMLFAALTPALMTGLSNGKTFKITRKKLNETYLLKSPYFWSKIDYYLYKKETQALMYEWFGDEKYKAREKRIQQAIEGYIENKRAFFEDTKNKALC